MLKSGGCKVSLALSLLPDLKEGGKQKLSHKTFFSAPQPENSQARISMSLRDIEILKIVAAVVDETHKLRNLVEKLVP